jgi:hypothetical protein
MHGLHSGLYVDTRVRPEPEAQARAAIDEARSEDLAVALVAGARGGRVSPYRSCRRAAASSELRSARRPEADWLTG